MLDFEACAIAGEMLRNAGFEHRKTSMRSEAVYYGWPGRHQVIRVARHKAGQSELNGVPVMASVVFNERNFKPDAAGVRSISRGYIIREVGAAIGQYMLASSGTVRARARYRNYHRGADTDLPVLDNLPE